MQDDHYLFVQAATAAEEQRFFFAHALSVFARSREMSPSSLLSWLGCDEADQVRLKLCRLPLGDSISFKDELTAISEFIGVPAAKLALIVRESEATEAIIEASKVEDPRMLLAARDSEQESPDVAHDASTQLDNDGKDQASS